MRILFMGTPEFAAVSLQELLHSTETVVGVVTQPDKPVGRKKVLTPPPVKVCAQDAGLPVFQPERLKNEAILPLLNQLKPELIVVVAYGRLLPKYVLEFPKWGCINVHGSLLPKYRGAAPIQWTIINGEQEAGVTTMLMNEGLDTGDILLQKSIPVLEEDDQTSMYDKLAQVGAKLLIETIEGLKDGSACPIKQDDTVATFAPPLSKETGRIDWNHTAWEIFNLVRGLNPWPSAFGSYNGKKFKVISASVEKREGVPGTILSASPKDGLLVACKEGALRIRTLQFEGSKAMEATQFLAGHSMELGKQLDF